MLKGIFGTALAGLAAGAANGLFGAGGGMILIPLLTLTTDLEDREVFPASVSIILPICIISLLFSPWESRPAIDKILYYMIGSAFGGVVCGFIGKKIPTKWLHKILGILILWGGFRYIC